jgi:hypothetical protein
MSLGDRLAAVTAEPIWYVRFPVVGLGIHSVPAALWAFAPWSLLVVAAGGTAGRWAGPQVLPEQVWRAEARRRWLTASGVGAVLVNLPLIVTAEKLHSPRAFTPTWLLLSVTVAVLGAGVRWRRPRLAGLAAGAVASGLALSIALSAWVRVSTADFNEAAARFIAGQTDNGDTVLVCDVPRTAFSPAPAGSFALHEFFFAGYTQAAILYETGRRVDVELRTGPCPGAVADLVVDFAALPGR